MHSNSILYLDIHFVVLYICLAEAITLYYYFFAVNVFDQIIDFITVELYDNISTNLI